MRPGGPRWWPSRRRCDARGRFVRPDGPRWWPSGRRCRPGRRPGLMCSLVMPGGPSVVVWWPSGSRCRRAPPAGTGDYGNVVAYAQVGILVE